MKLKNTTTPYIKGDTTFIEILADSAQAWHEGNFTISGGSYLGMCPDCPDIFMTGDV